MDTKHTAEEWTIPSHVAGPDIPIIAGSRIVALVVNDEDEPIDAAEQLANARLMAAAPGLLDACREAASAITYLLSNDDDDPNYADTLNTLAAAIAKADDNA